MLANLAIGDILVKDNPQQVKDDLAGVDAKTAELLNKLKESLTEKGKKKAPEKKKPGIYSF